MIKIAAFARFELGAVKGNEAEVKRKQEDFKVARNKWSVGGPIEEEKKLEAPPPIGLGRGLPNKNLGL